MIEPSELKKLEESVDWSEIDIPEVSDELLEDPRLIMAWMLLINKE